MLLQQSLRRILIKQRHIREFGSRCQKHVDVMIRHTPAKIDGNKYRIGELRFISMTMPKKWETYGIHALEALLAVTGPGYISIRNTGSFQRNICHLKHARGFDAVIANSYDMMYNPVICLTGTKGSLNITLKDSYTSFRNQLVSFIDYLRTGVPPMPFSETEELMKLVAGGIASREAEGKEIFI